ncbi:MULTISPECIES: hybrid-cluster NAD(P)-dependent oxidoreductase [Vibrio]|uniref:hybrid-cluster NAD(P)-dependent oxidoreductase n=1 Tax=Vibrio TaxID=662 RepID=UPI001302DFA7|nr:MULTISPECIES: hybrid-cluster NAD(P)-dependent oxidoreductase [Vibrio]EKO3616781.1 hybrid-cluster NAD(P)-dependent oxidoreductase [Vibrio metschnikovii]EKO3655494.1 hybrid-cluster NAD(P)-dependent oxidoreductase [Vibrio metschnikovii]EKO3677742.1 hybrid-cluster NAD(P)-dependent oxidoreductase [Vibrio metschnikovii]EKO3891187.1 hybrid-cluster NAD(P)-dependent oxidoreductase [Vibrio metschnikovii]MDQ2188293.1 hybrid-cluster NAD(P)-dependent oxidoreductase [Vibrio sp. A14(2019)]
MYFKWQGQTPVTLHCIDKFFETEDTVSLRFGEPSESLLFDFKPGQFINLGVKIAGKMEFRAYSISSLNAENYLQITVKRVDGGKVSNFLIDQLQVTGTVQALPPTGDFNCIDHPPKIHDGQSKVLLISAGCGITPVMAMIKYWLHHAMEIDIEFLHIARSPEQTLYFDTLATYHTLYDNFHLKLLLKDAKNSGYPQGKIDIHWLKTLVPDMHSRNIYLCGPDKFMRDIEGYLLKLGFDMANFYQESFSPIQTQKPLISDTEVKVGVANFAQTIKAQKGQLLADVLENAGVPLIIACRSGICGSCKCKISKGRVTTLNQTALTAKEIEEGYILTCSSTIESDIEINLN